jgi:very-short-patch-repair endonuclease
MKKPNGESLHQPDDWLAFVLRDFEGRVLGYLACCESPIEQTMMLALTMAPGVAWAGTQDWFRETDLRNLPFAVWHAGKGRLYCQFEVTVWGGARYRLDFALVTDTQKIAIEVDGHDFHERTKEQAARDKARDRTLVLDGWTVLRFTGSEVWRDARACVTDVFGAIGRTASDSEALASPFASGSGDA